MTAVRIPKPQGQAAALNTRLSVRLVTADGQPVLAFKGFDLLGDYADLALTADLTLELTPTAQLALPDGAATYYQFILRTPGRAERYQVQVPESPASVELADLVAASAIPPAEILAEILAPYLAARDEAQAAAAAAAEDAQSTAADRVQTGLDAQATAADRVQTGQDVIATAADRVQTGLDAQATAADRVQTGLDAIATAADRVQTGLDAQATAADRVQTGLDAIATAADRVQTGLDAIATAADRVQTGQDVIATAADRVQTGLDVIATAADRVQTGLDAIATAADRVQTGQDVIATAADRVQTGQDVIATAGSAQTATAAANAAAASYDSFDDRYLGAKASDPATDNDGDALVTGALYWNTATSVLKVWNGSAWLGAADTLATEQEARILADTQLQDHVSYALDLGAQAVRGLETRQPLDAELTALAALAVTDSNFIVGNGTTWVAESGVTARTSLGLGDSATKNVGTTSGTVAAGDDSRIKAVGTTAGTVAAGDDSRITGAATATNLTTETDNRVLGEVQLQDHLSYALVQAMQGLLAVAGGNVYLAAGAAGEPALSPLGDRDTGLFFPAANVLALATTGAERARLDDTGQLGLGTNAPSCALDVASNKWRLRTAKTPSAANDSGNAGDWCWDANYIYVCVATNTWKRATLATW